jgi:hypothetical protein
LRRLASSLTFSITGMAPVPVPITRRRHFQGISSSMESGVCPKASRNRFDGFFLAFADFPAVDHYVVLVGSPVDADRAEARLLEAHGHLRGYYTRRIYAINTYSVRVGPDGICRWGRSMKAKV